MVTQLRIYLSRKTERDENKVMLVKTVVVNSKGPYKCIIITTIIIAPFSTPALREKLPSLP